MNTSPSIAEISKSLATAQGEIENPSKDSTNPHFKSRYADLSSGINAVRAALSKNGLAITQTTRLVENILMLDTRLSHSSGEWMAGEYPVCGFPLPAQQIGSALTYARRYSLFAMIGISGDDDDGEEANKTATPARARPVAPAPPRRQPDFANPGGVSDAEHYANQFRNRLAALTEIDALRGLWNEEADRRADARLPGALEEALHAEWKARGIDLSRGGKA